MTTKDVDAEIVRRRRALAAAEREARALLQSADEFAGGVVVSTFCGQSVTDALYEAIQSYKASIRAQYAQTRRTLESK